MIIESFMDKLYFGSGTQDHLSTFRKWDFLKESAKAQESHHSFLFDGTEVPFPNPISKSHFQITFPKSL